MREKPTFILFRSIKSSFVSKRRHFFSNTPGRGGQSPGPLRSPRRWREGGACRYPHGRHPSTVFKAEMAPIAMFFLQEYLSSDAFQASGAFGPYSQASSLFSSSALLSSCSSSSISRISSSSPICTFSRPSWPHLCHETVFIQLLNLLHAILERIRGCRHPKSRPLRAPSNCPTNLLPSKEGNSIDFRPLANSSRLCSFADLGPSISIRESP